MSRVLGQELRHDRSQAFETKGRGVMIKSEGDGW